MTHLSVYKPLFRAGRQNPKSVGIAPDGLGATPTVRLVVAYALLMAHRPSRQAIAYRPREGGRLLLRENLTAIA